MAITFPNLVVKDTTNGLFYNASIAGQWFNFKAGEVKFALGRYDIRCKDFIVLSFDVPLSELPTLGDTFDCSEFYSPSDSRHKETSMSEKVSKPGDLDKFVPSKTSLPNFTAQSNDTTVAAKVTETVAQLENIPEALITFETFMKENAKIVGEMPKWKKEAYKVVPDELEIDPKDGIVMHHVPPPQAYKDADVKHPSHYTSHPSGVECISIVQHHNFNTGNAMKYLWRAGLKVPQGKNEVEAAIKDLSKAKEYIEFEIRRLTT